MALQGGGVADLTVCRGVSIDRRCTSQHSKSAVPGNKGTYQLFVLQLHENPVANFILFDTHTQTHSKLSIRAQPHGCEGLALRWLEKRSIIEKLI